MAPPTPPPGSSSSSLLSGARVVNVLVTGFSAFFSVVENPSWLAVSQLHGLSLTVGEGDCRAEVRVQCVQIPVVYAAVLDTVPRIHGNEPHASLGPAAAAPWLDPQGDQSGFAGDGRSYPQGYTHLQIPENGFDVVLHVGVGRNGAMKIETRARRQPYRIRDQRRRFAPRVDGDDDAPARRSSADAATGEGMQAFEAQRIAKAAAAGEGKAAAQGCGASHRAESNFDEPGALPRGFPTAAYPPEEGFADELRPPAIDAQALCEHLNARFPPIPVPVEPEAVDVSSADGAADADADADAPVQTQPAVQLSTDAGLFLCEFIYYASLAECLRGRRKDASVLFMHCPSVGQPLETNDVTAILREAILYLAQARTKA